MSQYNYIDFYLDVNGNIEESNLSQITQHSTNTIVRVLSEGLNVDSVFFSFKQVDGTALPKKLALLQPTLLEGYKVWQYRLTESDTALANPSPSPFKLTISLKKDDITNQLSEQTLTIVRSLQSAIVIPDASSIDGISDGFNAISEEVLKLDGMRDIGIENIVDNGDGTITIEYGDNELRTSNLTGPQGPVGPTGADGADGANAVLPTNLNNFNIGTASGTGYSFKNPDGTWVLLNLDADLTFIAGLNGTGFLKRTGVNTWALDTNEYISSLSVSAPLTIEGTGNNRTIAINAVSQTNAGVMGISDKIKLDGIATNANNFTYSHPTGFSNQPSSALTGASVISQVTVNGEGHVTGTTSRNLTPTDIAAASAVHNHGNISIDGKIGTASDFAIVTGFQGSLIARTLKNNGSPTALIDTDSLVTERAVYNGLPFINGDHTYTSGSTFFAPTVAGTAGYTLKSAGVGAPFWDVANNHTHGIITSNGFTTDGVANRALTTTTNGQITTTEVITTGTGAITSSNALLTAQRIFNGLSWVNNQRQSSDASKDIWAPITAGESGDILQSAGPVSTGPTWRKAPAKVSGSVVATNNGTWYGVNIGSTTNSMVFMTIRANIDGVNRIVGTYNLDPSFTATLPTSTADGSGFATILMSWSDAINGNVYTNSIDYYYNTINSQLRVRSNESGRVFTFYITKISI